MGYDKDIERRLWHVFTRPDIMTAAKTAVELYGMVCEANGELAIKAAYGGAIDTPPFVTIRAIAMHLCPSADIKDVGMGVQWMLWKAGNPRISRHYEYTAFYEKALAAQHTLAFSLHERPDMDVVIDKGATDMGAALEEIKADAVAHQISIKDLAEAAGLHYSSVYAWFRNRRTPKRSEVAGILRKLREAADKLMEQSHVEEQTDRSDVCAQQLVPQPVRSEAVLLDIPAGRNE